VSTCLRNTVPPQDAFTYEERSFPTSMESPYTGDPSPESEAAWHELVKSMSLSSGEVGLAHCLLDDNIWVPNSLFRESGQRSVEIADSENSIAQLSVFHALHCLVPNSVRPQS
jgi:hypothetical protein